MITCRASRVAKAASALLSLALVGGLMVGTAAPAWAEPGTSGGTYTPYSGQTRWDDPATGFTYFDVAGNDPRNLSDSDAFLRQVLTAYTPTNTNLSEKWRYLGLLAAVSNNTFFGDAYSLDDANQTKHYGISTDRGFIRGFLDEVFADGQIPVHEGGGLNQAVSVRAAAQQILDDTGLCTYWWGLARANGDVYGCDKLSNKAAFSDADLAKLSDAAQKTFYLEDRWGAGEWNAGIGVIFSDFQLAYLAEPTYGNVAGGATDPAAVPPSTHFSYTPPASSASFVSGTKNYSASNVTTTQTVSSSTAATITNSVASTSGYSYTASIGSSTTAKFGVLAGVSQTLNLGFEWSQTFSKTTTNESSQTVSNSFENGLSVSLPGHTGVVLRQTPTDMNMSMEYDYPVAVSFKVTVIGALANDADRSKTLGMVVAQFGRGNQPNAADNFWSRWSNRNVPGYEAANGDGLALNYGMSRLNALANSATIDDYGYAVYGCLMDFNRRYVQPSSLGRGTSGDGMSCSGAEHWYRLWQLFGIPGDARGGSYSLAYLPDTMSNYNEAWPGNLENTINRVRIERPMSLTGGVINVTSKGSAAEIYGIEPIYPLAQVRLTQAAEDYDLAPGDNLYVDNIGLTGLDPSGVDYYGFDKAFGHWLLVDDTDTPVGSYGLGGNTLPASLIKTPTGLTRLVANDVAGTVYLKYVIDEDVYSYIDHPATTTNAELTGTARIQVNVAAAPFQGSITVAGDLTGHVGDPAVNLDDPAGSGLSAAVLDTTGKELARALTWEAQELPAKGVKVENNQLSFTQAGTFHVRASSGDVRSAWVPVTALAARELASVTLKDISRPSAFMIPASAALPVSIPLNVLQVDYTDQYGDPFTPATPAVLEADGPAVAIDQGRLTVSGVGDIGVVAKVGSLTSNRIPVLFEAYAPFNGTIEVDGDLTGYVGDPAIDLDDPDESGLTAVISDTSGKELLRALTWEAKELPSKGIEVVGNKLTFTKAGTFHLRASSGGVQTGWIEVTALPKRVLDAIALTDTSSPSVFSIAADAALPASVPLSVLQVDYVDQYGDPFTPASAADFEADGVSAVIDQGMLNLSSRFNDAGVVAKLGGVVSNRIAVDFVRPVTDKDLLQAAYDTASAMSNAENTYVAQSWLALQSEIGNARQVLGDEWATQQQVDGALAALQAAVAGLELTKPAPNPAVLQHAHDTAKRLSNADGAYTAESWAKLQAEIVDALRVLGDLAAEQDHIDAAARKLHAALAGLVPKKLNVSRVKLNQSQLRLVKGKSFQLGEGVYYTNAHSAWAAKVDWKSSNTKVATVDHNGKVKAKKAGTVTITATTKDTSVSGKKLSASVKVVVVKSKGKAKVTKVTAAVPKTMKKGQTVYVTGKYSSDKATGVKVTYKSSKKSVVEPDSVGRLIAKGKGTAKITVKAGSKSKTYTVTVK